MISPVVPRTAACRARAAVALAAAWLLPGCVAPPPPRPGEAVAVPPQWAQPLPPQGAGPIAGWWSVFGDPMLVQLVEAAQQANTDIGVAAANLRQARAARDVAAADRWPGVSVSAAARRSRAAGGDGATRFDAGFDAAWEADVFGATARGVAAQQALVRSSAATLASVQVSVAAEVALAYVDLRGAQVRTAVALENLASQEETLQISRWRLQAGLASSLEVEQAVGAVEQTRAQVPVLRAAAARSAHALALLTGQPPAALLERLAPAGALPQPERGLAVAIPAAVLRQRPDVLAAEQQLRAAAERVAQADARRRPSVNLAASLSWSGVTLGGLGSAGAARLLLASIAQPLFDAGRLDAQLAAQRADYEAASQRYRASVLGALREVEDALAGLAAARERAVSLQRALEAARNAALLATQRHASGLIDFQTVLETQRTLLNVQDGVAGAQAELAADHVRLYKALGGGWRAVPPEQPS
ncbi:efflux transporter outer membrane subunit [Ramlibacter sp.]|uniref:efflux transporter outer membrane subunit n=1 Tax=Ramlibacter sp. TaxID=1917967 RepID=UPI002BF86D53|nr:efflux transporter outer membrane subunit [Ramlibacter sp.]HWI82477.1 efflux transporter outer membrane subunit [Ramlibacter sp.]